MVDSASSSPLAGALVALIDANRTVVAEALTAENGARILSAPAGIYRLRVRRIGFQPYVTPPVTLPRSSELLVPVPRRPVMLAALVTSARSSCRRFSSEGTDALATVWEEATKALQASQLTIEDLRGVGRGWTFNKTVGLRGEVRDADTAYFTISNRRPFGAVSPETLAAAGYVSGDGRTGWSYHGPDETVLLSPSFASTHCFRIVRDERERDLIGISFQPAPGRRTSDIAGTVWLDERSSELRKIVFRYVNSDLISRFGGGGETHFRRLPSGAWLVSDWFLRAPLLESNLREVSSAGFIENGGGLLTPAQAAAQLALEVPTPAPIIAPVRRDSAFADTSRTVAVRPPGPVAPIALPEAVTATLPNGKPARYANTDRLDGFYRRRMQGRGTFFTLEDIQRKGGSHVLDLVGRVPGIAITSPRGFPTIRVSRCDSQPNQPDGDPTWFAVFLDGHRVTTGGLQMLSTMHPSAVEAMEVYRGAAERPMEARGNICAAVFLWSRLGSDGGSR